MNTKDFIDEFILKRTENHRYSSFDFCYNYFYSFYKNNQIQVIWNEKNLENSCLQLWFYLASWWMLRWSSFLLQNSVRNFKNLILEISKLDKTYWEIDINNYTDENISKLLDLKNIIFNSFSENKPSETLITKIMLWIFWNIPAFDRYFKNWMNLNSVNKVNLLKLKDFYFENQELIDSIKIKTLDFNTWIETNIYYSKAKIIDMYWFTKGLNKI